MGKEGPRASKGQAFGYVVWVLSPGVPMVILQAPWILMVQLLLFLLHVSMEAECWVDRLQVA